MRVFTFLDRERVRKEFLLAGVRLVRIKGIELFIRDNALALHFMPSSMTMNTDKKNTRDDY